MTPGQDRYPPDGCVLRDKTTCKLPHVTCCDQGRAQRWPQARHLTSGEKRTKANAAAAVARALRHVAPPPPPDQHQPWNNPDWRVTPARARQIRSEIESGARNAR